MRQEETDALLEKIRSSAEDMTVPKRLEPENMMEELRDKTEGGHNRLNKKGWKRLRRYSAAAAVVTLTLSAVWLFQNAGVMMPTQPGVNAGFGEQAETFAELTAGAQAVRQEPEDDKAEPLTEPKEAKQYAAKSYEAIYEELESYKTMWMKPGGAGPGANAMLATDGAMGAEYKSESALLAPSASREYSDTNIQVDGVDEGDIVKTDGGCIYIMSDDERSIKIVEANGLSMKKRGAVSDTSTSAISKSIREFYVHGDKMSVIREAGLPVELSAEEFNDIKQDGAFAVACSSYQGKRVTYLETYDISNKDAPVLLGTVTQDGHYKSSRRTGSHIYLFTGYNADVIGRVDEIESYIPMVNQEALSYEDIYIPNRVSGCGYLVITAVDTEKPKETAAQKAVMSDGDCFYVSPENIYIASAKFDGRASQYDYTELLKLSYKNGRIVFKAHGNADGRLNNQFSMDEYQGNLRLVTTLSHSRGQSTTSLQVLDEDLKKIGEIEDLAPGEEVYSARFMGETGYFVTFRNMDPLFSADLSDPAKPQIIGELKITGFSEYLQGYRDGLMLGIGKEIDPDTGNFKGLKLSMFDISNPNDVKEERKLVEKSYENSPAWENHKAVLLSPGKNLIGFAVEAYDSDAREWETNYVLYSYHNTKGFQKELEYGLGENSSRVRGLYIGSCFYIAQENGLTAFRLDDFTQIKRLDY